MHGDCVIERRRNYLGRLVVSLHQRYCRPGLVPVLWAVVVVLGIVQIVFVTLG